MFIRTLLFISVYITSCRNREIKPVKPVKHTSPIILSSEDKPKTYDETKKFIDSMRISFRNLYLKDSANAKQLMKEFLTNTISDQLYNYWKGTPWDFNGTTTTPKEGMIACGFFVTGLLKDAGFKLPRTKLAVCPSLTMMKYLTSSKSIKNLSTLNYVEFVSWLKNQGKGVYIVGLDYHTGFIVHDGNEVWFIHSNYIYRLGVMKEKLIESRALKSSKTRYITSLTNNDRFLRNWIFN